MNDCARLSAHKGLVGAELLDLGTINIVCGRNNSGKTTVAEALVEHAEFGGSLMDRVDRIAELCANASGWKNTNAYTACYKRAREFFERTLAQRRAWFLSDTPNLAAAHQTFHRGERALDAHAFNINPFERALPTVFDKQPNTVLLPAKRSLETSVQIDTSQTPQPDGSGILNYLGYCQNRIEGDRDQAVVDRVMEGFVEVSDGFRFVIQADRDNHLRLWFRSPTDQHHAAGDSGLGLQDLLVILTFAVDDKWSFVAIEEPESHLHPDMQRRLLFYLRSLTEKRFLLTTHSNVFLDSSLVDRVFFVTYDTEVKVGDATSVATVLYDIGYSVSDNLVSDLVILTEGPKDIPVIRELLHKMDLTRRYQIRLWPLGGDIMDQVDLSVFSERYKILAIIDRDPGSQKVRKRFIENCAAAGIPVRRLKRHSIENYFSIEALRSVFPSKIPDELTEIKPNVTLADQVGFNVRRNNGEITRAMNLNDIRGTDLFEILQKVEEMVTATPSVNVDQLAQPE